MKKILIIFVIVVIILICWQVSSPNKEVMSTPDEPYLVIADEFYIDDNYVIIIDDIYIAYDIVKEKIDTNLFYDLDEEMLIYTDQEKVIRYELENNKANINYKDIYIMNPIKLINEKVYIPREILVNIYDISLDYFEDSNAIVMDKLNSKWVGGEIILDGAHVRTSFNRKAPIVVNDLPVETSVLVFEELKDWYKIRTSDGIVGYIEKKFIKTYLPGNSHEIEQSNKYKKPSINGKINMTWDYTNKKTTNLDSIEPIEGINVISPTWFSIKDSKRNIEDKGNHEYVAKYKALGYEIWPLIDNSVDPDLTHELLISSNTRRELIEKIVHIYDGYGVDGINIDFENIYLKDKPLLTQFVRELYPIFKSRGMTVSIDVTPISTSENWSLSFDRRGLAETVDYIALMAYDQHWAASPIAGSVAQYNWVEKCILEVLEEVPKNKLILGIPFYTRLWKVDETEEGEKVSSEAISMERANKFIDENDIDLIWDKESGQYYGEVEKEGTVYKLWVEDVRSISLKTSLVNKYDLAGVASWRRGFETEEVWPALFNTIILN